MTEKYGTPRATHIQAFEDRYGKGGLDVRDLENNKAEQEAVKNEYEVYEQQYEEAQKSE